MNGFEKLILDNLKEVFEKRDIDEIRFKALGEECIVKPDGIFFSGKKDTSAISVIISLYVKNHLDYEPVLEPFISIKDMPDSMPYREGFHANAELPLVPYVQKIYEKRDLITDKLGPDKDINSKDDVGDFSFVLFPLPKIALKYIFYFADEEFPASVTCLFSKNATLFLPTDPLADLAEYTGKKILEIVNE